MNRGRPARAGRAPAPVVPAGRAAPPAPVPPRAWRGPVLAVVLAWALLFFPHLFLGRRVVFADAGVYRPFAEFSRARWHAVHERTEWNPYVFLGLESVASLADPRPQYLPAVLVDALDAVSTPAFAPQLWLLLAHLAGTLSLLALARRLWGADPWSAAAGALVWLPAVPLLGPFGHGADAQFLTTALVPAALLATHGVFHATGRRRPLAAALALAAVLGLQALHGHPQLLIYGAMLVAAFAVQQARPRAARARAALWAGGVLLGGALGAAVAWPALLYGAASRGGDARGIPLATVAHYSLAVRDLVTFAWAHALGFGRDRYWGGLRLTDFPPYLGAGALALAAGLANTGRRAPRAGGEAFWWGVFAFAALFALGASTGLAFDVVRHLLPFWTQFRGAWYVVVFAALALALLVPLAAMRATAPGEPAPPRALLVPALAAGGLALVGAAIAFGPLREAYVHLALAARPALAPGAAGAAATGAGLDLALRAALVLAALAAALASRAGRPRAWLAIVLALDVASVSAPELWRSTGAPAAIAPPPPTPLARVLSRDPHARGFAATSRQVDAPAYAMAHYPEALCNFWVSWGARSLTGELGAFPAAWEPVMRHALTGREAALRAWGVRWLGLDRDAVAFGGAPVVAGDAHVRVQALPGAPGRAYAAARVITLPDPEAVARAMAADGFEPTAVALTTDAAAAGEYPGSAGAAVTWRRDDPEHLALDVAATARAFVVVADAWSPGWTARVDGAPARLVPTDLLVRGVAVPAGHHRLTLDHATPARRAGVAVTRAALGLLFAALVAVAVAESRARRRAIAGHAAPVQ